MNKHNLRLIPLFPLPIVMFPEAVLPLHTFEERYKAMIRDILETDRTFGIVFVDRSENSFAQFGCSAVVSDVEDLSDGRLNIVTKGESRFRIIETLDDKPYLRARVEVILEPPVPSHALSTAEELRVVLSDVLRLSSKLLDKDIDVSRIWPTDPTYLSYMVPATLYGSPLAQQKVLELESTEERLADELELLDAARKHLAAQAALKDAVG